jgi:hypothetical protein
LWCWNFLTDAAVEEEMKLETWLALAPLVPYHMWVDLAIAPKIGSSGVKQIEFDHFGLI